jgi:hypothetical protein
LQQSFAVGECPTQFPSFDGCGSGIADKKLRDE